MPYKPRKFRLAYHLSALVLISAALCFGGAKSAYATSSSWRWSSASSCETDCVVPLNTGDGMFVTTGGQLTSVSVQYTENASTNNNNGWGMVYARLWNAAKTQVIATSTSGFYYRQSVPSTQTLEFSATIPSSTVYLEFFSINGFQADSVFGFGSAELTYSPLQLVYPGNGASTNSNVPQFVYLVSVPTSSVQYLKVSYGTSTALGDDLWLNLYGQTPGNVSIPTDRTSFANGTWYLRANVINRTYTDLYNYFDTVAATSTLDSFDVTGYVLPGGIIPVPTSTTSTIQCTDWFCDLFTYFFVPLPTTLDHFASLWDGIKNKPPIGYFIAIQQTLQSVATSTPAFSFPDLSRLDAGLFSPLRTALSTILWLLCAFWFLDRFRNIQL